MILETETFERWMHEIIARLDRHEQLLSTLKGTEIKEVMYVDGERLLDNQDLCQLLQTSKQSLQRYRSSGMLRYRKLRHKTYYTESDVQEFLKKHLETFSAAELSAKKTTFALPDAVPGTVCEFYAVANLDMAQVNSSDVLVAMLEQDAASYNGTFAEVSTKAKRTGGFVMSGMASKAVAAAGSTTDVAITLKRTVAKVAIQVTPSPQFGSLYQGAVRVNSITLSNAATQTLLFHTTYNPGAFNFSTTQASDAASGKYRNLFYLYESPARNVGSRVKATIDATYDMDGDFSTAAGQSSMIYEVELDGTSGGEIRRNGYYRVDITINGLSGHDASLTITPAEWESPVTQTVELGA